MISTRSAARLAALTLPAFAPAVCAQSLFLSQSQQNEAPAAQPGMDASQISLLWVPEPERRIFAAHDIITIIVDENSSTTSSQKLETEKDASTSMQLNSMLKYLALLELRLEAGDTNNLSLLDATAAREFTGEGDYERKDKFTARITATVLEVKPNGNLVLQAKKRIEKDDEIQTLVLYGVVREDDITSQNTILSSQMADLNISVKNEGELRDAAKKGIITNILDALFAF